MVSDINLNNNQLEGQIPAELGQLAALTRLDLNNNQLSGPIPAELGQLAALTILYLHHNQLSGPSPAELGLHTHTKFTSKNPSHLSRTQ